MVVSRWPVSVVVEVSLVSPSPPQCVLCAKKFALRGLVVGVSAKKFAHCAHNGSKLALSGVLGEVFRGNAAGGAVLGEVFRGRAAGGAVLGEFFRGPAVVGVAAGPLLAVLTLQCAATPYGWHGGQPAQATTHRVNVRRMRSQRWGLESSQAPGTFHISRETTEAGSRRIPPLVACGGRAVCADKPAPETQCPSLSSVTTVAVASGANAQFFHQPLTVSTAWAPRSDSAVWALTRPEDRRAAWKREATFSQFTRFHQALT